MAAPSPAKAKNMNNIKRCGWAAGGDALMIRYHDEEWGVPVFDDKTLFEFLILEGAQAGLSWQTILRKRENYRRAFAGFDPAKVARFNDAKIAELLQNPGLVRNRLKIGAAVGNARAFLQTTREFGTFARYAWGFVGGKPAQNRLKSMAELPATTPQSEALAKDLKRRGFKFVGGTIAYAFMQATGMVNDHEVGCFCRAQCKKLAAAAAKKAGGKGAKV